MEGSQGGGGRGTLASTKVYSLQSEGVVKGTCMADMLSTAQQVENVNGKSNKVMRF